MRTNCGGRSQKGFSLIELIVTLGILALLASIAVPLVQLTAQRNKEQEFRAALRQIREAIDAYKQAWDDGRIVKKVGESGYPKSIDLLVEGVDDQRTPDKSRIYFLRRVPRDPFNRDKDITAAETWGVRSYTSPAHEPTVGSDVYDVYTFSDDVGINGIPYKEW